MTLLIRLTVADIDTGPFNLYSNVNLYVSPFAELIEKSDLLAGYISTVVPDGTTSIEVRSVNELCTNFIILTVDTTTSTTSTSTSTSTSTTTITTTINTSCSTCSVVDVTIGTQIWTGCNLDISTYSDGTPIPQVTDPTQWASLTTGAWCYFNNNAANCVDYGKLYNWYAVAGIWNEASKTDASQRKQLAPTGYHIPSSAEWTSLYNYLGGQTVAGGKMKEAGTLHWQSPNTGATNSSGLTALPGGACYASGSFQYISYYGWWWSSSEYNTTNAWYSSLSYTGSSSGNTWDTKRNGFAVRCIKD